MEKNIGVGVRPAVLGHLQTTGLWDSRPNSRTRLTAIALPLNGIRSFAHKVKRLYFSRGLYKSVLGWLAGSLVSLD